MTGATSTYDRRGQPATIADASGTRTLGYTADGQPEHESYTAGLFAGLTVDRGYDALGRRNALGIPALGAGLATGYGYDGASRLETVTAGTIGATYSRASNSPFLASVAFTRSATPVMTTTRTYDHLDRQFSQATSVAGTGSAATSAGYLYNAASQRTKLTREDGSAWDYGYDALGQVTSGSRKWSDATPVAGQQFGYAFDQIGNRQTATVNGRVSTYTPNLLNQYASRTVPGAVDVQGEAQPQAVVTVNGHLTARKGSYYAGTAPVDNSAAAVDAELKIVGVRNQAGPNGEDAVTEQTGRAFVPRTPESFTHDLDGNLTSDGRFTYIWDGENRLIAVEAHATTPATAKVKVTMVYDAQSRRVQKQVHTWNASTSSYQLSTTLRFLYDGWNLITELNASNQVVRSYVWGLDLSGSLQGAGGVGGLLVFTDAATGTQSLPTYDGNGNILALINAADGTLTAQYEYGPFGESLRATGLIASANPFRFSSKYHDIETGLLYYGYRYYQPDVTTWLSRDPLNETDSCNLSIFVGNAPINKYDILGLAGFDWNESPLSYYLPYLYPNTFPKPPGYPWSVWGAAYRSPEFKSYVKYLEEESRARAKKCKTIRFVARGLYEHIHLQSSPSSGGFMGGVDLFRAATISGGIDLTIDAPTITVSCGRNRCNAYSVLNVKLRDQYTFGGFWNNMSSNVGNRMLRVISGFISITPPQDYMQEDFQELPWAIEFNIDPSKE